MPTTQTYDLALRFTDHARARGISRNIPPSAVSYIVIHGTEWNAAGATFIILRSRDIPHADRRDPAIARLAGIVVLLDQDEVITKYRPKNPVRHVRRKAKYDASRRARAA